MYGHHDERILVTIYSIALIGSADCVCGNSERGVRASGDIVICGDKRNDHPWNIPLGRIMSPQVPKPRV